MVKKIRLTQGKKALVDDDDYEHLIRHKWFAHTSRNLWYALRSGIAYGGSTAQQLRMHSEIIDCPNGFVIDHIDGNGLNNQRSNLRIVTHRENCQNHHRVTSSIYPGVAWHKNRGCWIAYAKVAGNLNHLGCYQNEHDAYIAYKTFVENLPEECIGVIL